MSLQEDGSTKCSKSGRRRRLFQKKTSNIDKKQKRRCWPYKPKVVAHRQVVAEKKLAVQDEGEVRGGGEQ